MKYKKKLANLAARQAYWETHKNSGMNASPGKERVHDFKKPGAIK